MLSYQPTSLLRHIQHVVLKQEMSVTVTLRNAFPTIPVPSPGNIPPRSLSNWLYHVGIAHKLSQVSS